MREIIFRGKRFDNGEWVYGYYQRVLRPNDTFVHIIHSVQIKTVESDADMPVSFLVDPATVGQYTGLKDKKDKKIFEGDVLNTNGAITVIEWRTPYFVGFQFIKGKFNQAQAEIIGNVYDNPELMKGR